MPIIAPGKVAGRIVIAVTAFTENVRSVVADVTFPALEESVTSKVTVPPPPPVGVPLTTPVLAAKLNPGGNVPFVMLHVNGLVPPDSVRVALYAAPGITVGRDEEVVVMAGGALTFTCKVANFEVSVIDVAVIVAVNALVTDAGAP